MKICGVSDLHGNLPDIPECEVLCICGDIVGINDQRNIEQSRHWWYNRFTTWVNKQPCEKVIATAGNHDFFIEKAYKDGWLNELKQDLNVRTNGKLVILIDESYTYKDIKFYGSPWIQPIPFQEGKWAFEQDVLDKGKDSYYSKIPQDTNVLITHDNPNKNMQLYEYCQFDKLAHLFGHWHDGIAYKRLNEYNVSLLDDWYNHKKTKPLEQNTIDIMTPININYITAKTVYEFIAKFIESLNTINFDTITKEELLEIFNNLVLSTFTTEEEPQTPWNEEDEYECRHGYIDVLEEDWNTTLNKEEEAA